MSIVVIVEKAGKAVIAADTLYTFGSTNVPHNYLSQPEKIYRVGDSYIGLVGAVAHGNVFEHILENEKRHLSFNNKTDIFNTYLKLHTILKEKYFLNTNEDDDDEYESSQINGLIANSNGIFGMYSLREVHQFKRFWAVGSGMEYALGALQSVYDLYDEPEQIAEIAVKAAYEFDDGCGLPMTLHSVILEIETSQTGRESKGRKKS